MWRDIRRRAPYYWSDFVEAWDYRVVPATVYMFFAKYVICHNENPAAALCRWRQNQSMNFLLDMPRTTSLRAMMPKLFAQGKSDQDWKH